MHESSGGSRAVKQRKRSRFTCLVVIYSPQSPKFSYRAYSWPWQALSCLISMFFQSCSAVLWLFCGGNGDDEYFVMKFEPKIIDRLHQLEPRSIITIVRISYMPVHVYRTCPVMNFEKISSKSLCLSQSWVLRDVSFPSRHRSI